jgi:Polyketide cyclase / dehydrase and lipid transport
MRWVLGVVGLLVLLVVVVCVIGYMLPKSHVASVSARFAAPPDSIWTSLTDVTAFPAWRPNVSRVELLPDENGHRGWREIGKDDAVTYRVAASVPPRHLVTRIADENLPYGGRWTYDLTPDGPGTRLTITENGEVYNPIFRFVSRFFLGYTSSMEGVLRALGTKHGEAVAPEPAAPTSR